VICRLKAGASAFDIANIVGTGIIFIQEHYGHFDQAMARAVAFKHFAYSRWAIRECDVEYKQPLIKQGSVGTEQSLSDGSIYLGKGVTFKGSIICSNTLFVSGEVNGTIQARSLKVTKNGKVDGEVKVRTATIDGNLGEFIEAKETISIGETAEVSGEIICADLQISKGAVIRRKVDCFKNMKTPEIAKAGGG